MVHAIAQANNHRSQLTRMLKKYVINQPLFHFLLIGLAIFLAYEWINNNPEPEPLSKRIVVDRDTLVNFMQKRSKVFNPGELETRLDNMSDQDLKRLINDYLREEVLYREALGLGLDQDDYVIRRRLVQKLEFINLNLSDDIKKLDAQQLNSYYNENKDLYYVDPHITFTHVFYNKDKNGPIESKLLAQDKLNYLTKNNVPFDKSTEHGDRFIYHTNYVARTPDYVESHFGPSLKNELFTLDQSRFGEWIGPIKSPFGYHLVNVSKREDGRYPSLDEIYDRVRNDAVAYHAKKLSEENIQKIIDSYDIEIRFRNEPKNPGPGPGVESQAETIGSQ